MMIALSPKAPLFVTGLLILTAFLAPEVDAHGWCQKPLARQFCNGKQLMWQVNDSGGNGARGMSPPYGGVPGICGDPFEANMKNPVSNFAALPCEPQETYQEGGILTTQIDVAANHGGYWEVSICDSKEISQECFDRNKLKTVDFDSEEWWIKERKLGTPSNNRPDAFIMDWKLPPGLVCDHCVLQWTYWTAHNCLYECDAAVCGPDYSDRRNKVVYPQANWQMPICETKFPPKGKSPQIFKNCADIKIVGSGGPTTPEANTTTPGGPTTPEANTTTPEGPTTPEANTTTPEGPTTPEANTTTPLAQVTNPAAKYSEESACTMSSRRFLLDNGEVLEEEDSIEDISGAGNLMNCGDPLVEQVLVEINHMRTEAGAQPVECSNRAVGTSSNFANIMADLGHELEDSADNCELADFGGRCAQMVATGGTGAPLTTLDGIDHAVLVAPEYAVAGVGYYDVDGVTYWTLLMG